MLNRSSADDRDSNRKGILRIPLPSARTKALLLGAGLLLLGLYIGLVVRIYVAWQYAATLEAGSLQRAIELEPGNASHYWALGRVQYFSQQDFPAAVRNYQRATALQPAIARYWLDLAAAQQVLGDTAAQGSALQHAVQADPTTPDLLREAANYYLALGDREEALRLFGVVVRNDPAAALSSLELCWRATGDVDLIAEHVLPRNADAYLAFLNTLVDQKQTAAALRLWPRLLALRQDVKPQGTFRFIHYLIEHGEVRPAYQAWRDLARISPGFEAYLSDDNLIFNAGFEQDILNGGFGWRYQSSKQVGLAIDSVVYHGGRRSLAVSFQGEPVADAGIFQFVPVEPRTSYRLIADVRTDRLEGANAPRFGVRDTYSGAWVAQSEEIQDASAWSTVVTDFSTGADTRLVELRLVRQPAHTRIRGLLWVDDVRMVKR